LSHDAALPGAHERLLLLLLLLHLLLHLHLLLLLLILHYFIYKGQAVSKLITKFYSLLIVFFNLVYFQKPAQCPGLLQGQKSLAR